MAAEDRVVEERRELGDAIRRQDVQVLARYLFGIPHTLTQGQVEIVRAVAFGEHRRVVIKAPTRYGKTWCIALGLCLRFILDARPLDARLLGPAIEQVEMLREYVVTLLLASRHLRSELEVRATGLERLKSETSKRKLTFRDGKSIWIQTASGDAFRLMGHGGDLIIVIEACLVNDDAWTKILRMAGDDSVDEDASDETSGWIVKEGNPWHDSNHYGRAWKDPAYHKVDIRLAQAVQEGRIRPAFLEEQRRELSPVHYTVLYESVFPDVAEGQLYAGAWIRAATTRPPPSKGDRVAYSLDVARGGGDLTVLTRFLETDHYRYADEQWDVDLADTEKIAAWTHGHVGKAADVVVDSNGVGAGVADKLRALGHDVTFFIQADKAHDANYDNRKAETFWRARQALETGTVGINPALRTLAAQLSSYRWSLNARGKIRIDDPAGKSPDHGDSFIYRFDRRLGPKEPPRGVARPNPLTRMGRL